MITGDQIRAGRELLNWSARVLSERAGVGPNTVQRMESAGAAVPSGLAANLDKVQKALEAGGIEFRDGGWVRRSPQNGA